MLELRATDYHTAGEPFRIVTSGFPEIPGATILDRREAARGEPVDRVRRLLCHEPRGHADMYGCFVVPPVCDDSAFGVLFWHKDGFSTACGHGTIALGAWAVESGRVAASDDGTTDVLVDAPSGQVRAEVTTRAGRVESVTFANVPSFVHQLDVEVDTSRGPVTVDVSYGGAMYASLPASAVGLSVRPERLTELIAVGREIKHALDEVVRHPADDRLSGVYGTIWYDDLGSSHGTRQRNCTVFADGQVDRSPCGSGTSARLAVLHARGAVGVGTRLRHESIVDTVFDAAVVGVDADGRVLTEVRGQAFVTGEHRFLFDDRDPLDTGFVLR